MKCSVPCFYCINMCSVCFTCKCSMTIKLEGSVPNPSVSKAGVCGVQCADYALSAKEKSTKSKDASVLRFDQSSNGDILFSVQLNSEEFGFEEGMLQVHLHRNSGAGDSFIACCQIRRPYFQSFVLLNVSNDCKSFKCISRKGSIVSRDQVETRLIAKIKNMIEP